MGVRLDGAEAQHRGRARVDAKREKMWGREVENKKRNMKSTDIMAPHIGIDT
jgi:hypothetical protein